MQLTGRDTTTSVLTKRGRLGRRRVAAAGAIGALALLSACIPPTVPPIPGPTPTTSSSSSTSSTTSSSTSTSSTTSTTVDGTLGPVHIVLTEEPAVVVSPVGDTLVLEAFVLTDDTNEIVNRQFVFQWSCSDSAGGQGCAVMTVRNDSPHIVTFPLIHTVTYTVTLSVQEWADPLNGDVREWTFRAEPPLGP